MAEAARGKHRFERIAFLSSGTPEADAAMDNLVARHGNHDPASADVIVALGGDGLMLQSLHRFMGSKRPIYGMNRGSVGFLMNEYQEDGLIERLAAAEASMVHPLLMIASDMKGDVQTARAINEVSLLRQTFQAAKLRISVDGRERLSELVADGALVATPHEVQDSSLISVLARSQALIVRPPHAQAARAGDICTILPLARGGF